MNWQPIETAHKSGFLIMLCEEGRFVHMGYWDHDLEHWVSVLGRVGTSGVCFPSHWMPLPKPPKGE